MRFKSYLKTSTGRVALLLLGTLSGSRSLSARALSARRLSLSSGHFEVLLFVVVCWEGCAKESQGRDGSRTRMYVRRNNAGDLLVLDVGVDKSCGGDVKLGLG